MGYIYKITNLINGKSYIGQTTWPVEMRWRQHITDAKGTNKEKCYALHRAFLKYGIENFSFKIVEELENDKLNEREQYWIKFWHTCIYDEKCKGYNLTWGGEGIKTINPEPIIELWNQGYSEGEIVKLTNHTDITISGILKMAGITSEEISNRGINKSSKKNCQKIYQYDLQGNLIKEYNSLTEAAKENNILIGNISEYLSCLEKNKKGRRTCGGCLWTKTPDDLQKALNKYNDNNYKRNRLIGQFDLNNNFLQSFDSLTEAQNKTGINRKQIANVCKKIPKYKTAGGFKWKFLDEENEFNI